VDIGQIFDRFRRRKSTGGILGGSWEMELVLWDFMMMACVSDCIMRVEI
jgi:hypothetical protein